MRTHLSMIALALGCAALLAACTADLKEGCVHGVCTPNGTGTGGASTTSTGNMGMGGAGGTCAPGPEAGDIPCEVFEVIHRECHTCHVDPPKNGAPFPLLSYEDTQMEYTATQKRYQRMNEVIRPGGIPRMPLGGMLNDKDLMVLGDWLASCAQPTAQGMGCECPGMGCTP